MQTVLKREIESLEVRIRELEPQMQTITQRLSHLYRAEAERQAEREQLLAEWPKLEARERGESLRRLFRSVKLYWEREFHPASPSLV